MRPTEAVRFVMRKHGCVQLFTNRYDKCQTVKCYARNTEIANSDLINNIGNELHSMGLTEEQYSIKRKFYDNAKGWGPHDSIIVRIDGSAQA